MLILILLILVSLGGLVAAVVFGFGGDERRPGVAVACLVAVALAWVACSITTVGANTQSVRTSFGKPTGVIGSGFHFVAPWSSGTDFSAANQFVQFKGDGNGGEDGSDEPCLKVRLARQATACVDGVVYYTQPADQVQGLFLSWKTEIRIRTYLVLANTQQALNEAYGAYDPLGTAEQDKDALAKYSTLSTTALNTRIGDKLRGLTVQLSNIDYDDDTEKRIGQVQAALAETRVAEQKKLTADQIALANKTIAESLKGDAVTAYYRCVEMITQTLRDIKPQTVDLQAVCAAAVGVLK